MAKVCIIPARGGSKRIPGKNIRGFAGKPIIAYSIEVALRSKLFDEVMVSTDDESIAAIARQYGAQVPFLRSRENSGDISTTADVLAEVLARYDAINQPFQYACCIYPTAPFVSEKDIASGFEKLVAEKRHSVFAVVAYDYPIWRSLKPTEDGRVEMFWPEYRNARSQDLQQAYHDAGQWYWLDCATFLNDKKIYSENSSSVILNPLFVQDIDDEIDWKLAELKFKFYLNRNK